MSSFKWMFSGNSGNNGSTGGTAFPKTSMSQSVEERVRIGRINAFLKQNGIGTVHSMERQQNEFSAGFEAVQRPKVQSMLFDYASAPTHFEGNAKAAKLLGVAAARKGTE